MIGLGIATREELRAIRPGDRAVIVHGAALVIVTATRVTERRIRTSDGGAWSRSSGRVIGRGHRRLLPLTREREELVERYAARAEFERRIRSLLGEAPIDRLHRAWAILSGRPAWAEGF